jgi:hypothetical protein
MSGERRSELERGHWLDPPTGSPMLIKLRYPERGHTGVVSILKAFSAEFFRFRFNCLAEEAFLPHPCCPAFPSCSCLIGSWTIQDESSLVLLSDEFPGKAMDGGQVCCARGEIEDQLVDTDLLQCRNTLTDGLRTAHKRGIPELLPHWRGQ